MKGTERPFRYTGQFSNGKMEGFGRMETVDLIRKVYWCYVGEFVGSARHGQGYMLSWPLKIKSAAGDDVGNYFSDGRCAIEEEYERVD